MIGSRVTVDAPRARLGVGGGGTQLLTELIVFESGKSLIEALHYYKMILKSFKRSKLSSFYGIIRDKE